MGNRTRVAKWVFGGLVGLLGLVLVSPGAEARDRRLDAFNLVGSWQCTGSRDAEGFSFLTTFNEGGTHTVSANLGEGETHGNWRRTGLRTFESTDLTFIYENEVATVIQLAHADYLIQSPDRLRIDLVVDRRSIADGKRVILLEEFLVNCNRIRIGGDIDFPPVER